MDRLAKEPVATKLHANNTNREEEFGLSKAWNPSSSAIRTLSTGKSMLQRREIN
jgi:hypothetical protein